MKNFRKIIEEHVARNIKIYTILVILFFIGLITGIIMVNTLDVSEKAEISAYINDFIGKLKSGTSLDYLLLLKNSFVNNFIIVFILWFMSMVVIGIPVVYGTIAYKGFCIGYTISAAVITLGTGKALLFTLTAMLLNNIILLPSIFLGATSGINLYHSILKDRGKENIKLEIIRHTIMSIIIVAITLLASIVETYVSSNLLISISKYL
mgnify:FL=1